MQSFNIFPTSTREAKRLKVKRYWSEKPCKKNGHIGERWTNGGCIECNHHDLDIICGHMFRTVESRQRSLKKKGKKFREVTITIEDIKKIYTPICPILGIPLVRAGKRSDRSPTVDRVDNNLGYVPGNIMVVSNLYNRIKSNITDPEILKLIADGFKKIFTLLQEGKLQEHLEAHAVATRNLL